MATASTTQPRDIDPIVQKYFVEAAKRKREDGLKQFETLQFSESERLRSLVEDIWANHEALDALPVPIQQDGRIKFLVLGAGLGGIVMAVKLVQKGFSAADVLLVDIAGGVGGTWYWNRYPGLHCDVESYSYLPFLEETGYMPKKRYSSSVEIRTYLEHVVDKFGLSDRILLRTRAKKLEWNNDEKTWRVEVTTHRGAQGKQEAKLSFYADNVIIADGVLPHPHVPKLPGLAQFARPMLHTARWNYDITGGSGDDETPDLAQLKNKVVGVVGTGATAIQVIPQLARFAKEVYVFQRTPSHVFALGQTETNTEYWHNSVATKPGWQRARREANAEAVTGNLKSGNDTAQEGWAQLDNFGGLYGTTRFGIVTPDKAQQHIGTVLALDSRHSEKSRSRISEIVRDKETAKKLTPWYPTWCKRPTFSDGYLESFNSNNVHLVDTDGAGINSFTPEGIVANGREYPIDLLILSTGFLPNAAAGGPGTSAGLEIISRNGRDIAEKWRTQGISTLHGVMTNGFPNLFILGVLQAAATANFAHMVDVMSEHIASIVAIAYNRSRDGQRDVVIEPTVEAEEAWSMKIAQGSAIFSPNTVCTPGYQNLEGEALKMPAPDDHIAMMKKAKGAIWHQGIVDFTRLLERWRENGKLEGLEVTGSKHVNKER